MRYTLYNTDRKVLAFDFKDMYLEVLDDEFLPYALRGRICTSSCDTKADIKKTLHDIDAVKDFLSNRVLSFRRSNAKAILNAAHFPQKISTNNRAQIALSCMSLSMTDNFWTKPDDTSDLKFADVNLRKNKLSDASYSIAILGKPVLATRDELRSDVMGQGMYSKFWKNVDDTVEIWKTDKTNTFVNTNAELQVSELLDTCDIPHVRYRREIRDGRVFAVSKCFVDDEMSFVTASDVAMSLISNDLLDFDATGFANMCVTDYVFANTDRHSDNWGFLVNNATNRITKMAPLFDHNQALVADYFGTDIRDLIYEPTGKTYAETLSEYAGVATLELDKDMLPKKCKERYLVYLNAKRCFQK